MKKVSFCHFLGLGYEQGKTTDENTQMTIKYIQEH